MAPTDRLGRIRIPPIPKETALIDRSNGNTYAVVKANGAPSLSLLTGTVELNRYWLYRAHEGPVVADDAGRLQRLYSDGGTLSFEPAEANVRYAPVDALVSRRPLEVWRVAIESGALTLAEVDT